MRLVGYRYQCQPLFEVRPSPLSTIDLSKEKKLTSDAVNTNIDRNQIEYLLDNLVTTLGCQIVAARLTRTGWWTISFDDFVERALRRDCHGSGGDGSNGEDGLGKHIEGGFWSGSKLFRRLKCWMEMIRLNAEADDKMLWMMSVEERDGRSSLYTFFQC